MQLTELQWHNVKTIYHGRECEQQTSYALHISINRNNVKGGNTENPKINIHFNNTTHRSLLFSKQFPKRFRQTKLYPTWNLLKNFCVGRLAANQGRIKNSKNGTAPLYIPFESLPRKQLCLL